MQANVLHALARHDTASSSADFLWHALTDLRMAEVTIVLETVPRDSYRATLLNVSAAIRTARLVPT